LSAGEVLYTLRFEVKENAQLKDVFSISSKYTNAEAYFEQDRVGGVQLELLESFDGQLTIFNSPNPFTVSTQIQFDAPEKGEALIRVSDISGKEVHRIELDALQGRNQLIIDRSDLQSPGIYILKVELNGSSAAKKIILIE